MLEGLTPPPNKAVYCKVDLMAQELDEADRKIFMAAIDDSETWGARTLTNALRQRGLSIADTTVTKHRVKACACYR